MVFVPAEDNTVSGRVSVYLKAIHNQICIINTNTMNIDYYGSGRQHSDSPNGLCNPACT
jgi:hypothetical protein